MSCLLKPNPIGREREKNKKKGCHRYNLVLNVLPPKINSALNSSHLKFCKFTGIESYVHLLIFYAHLIQFRVAGGAEPIAAVIG